MIAVVFSQRPLIAVGFPTEETFDSCGVLTKETFDSCGVLSSGDF